MNYTYIFIMILIFVIIYGLLFRIKNNKIIKTIESFENNSETEDINETTTQQYYSSALPKLFNGQWTSMTTEIINDQPTDTIMFSTLDNNHLKMRYNNNNYSINFNKDGTGTTNTIDGNTFKFNSNPDYSSYRLPYDVQTHFRNIPIMEMSNQNHERALIFKFANGKLANSVTTLLENNNASFKGNEPQISGNFFDSKLIKAIQNYKFSPDALTGNYMQNELFIKKYGKRNYYAFTELNKNKFGNVYSFQLKRNFQFSNNQSMDTKYSQLYNIPITKDNSVLVSLNHKKLAQELAENKINNLDNVTTYIYFQNLRNTKETYDFKKNDFYNKDELKLKNGAENYFEDALLSPNLNSVTRTTTSKFTPTYFSEINTFDKDNFKKGISTTSTIKIL